MLKSQHVRVDYYKLNIIAWGTTKKTIQIDTFKDAIKKKGVILINEWVAHRIEEKKSRRMRNRQQTQKK
jgi:hypothetical protein